MNKIRLLTFAAVMVSLSCAMQSCLDDNDDIDRQRPTALVTVRPASDGSFTLQLDNTTTLYPTNVKTSPYGEKEVRALVNYTPESDLETENKVHINWIDSIRTKTPVLTLGDENDSRYGNDAIEIVNDWVTVAEDGYLTLRVRTLWGMTGKKHNINLLSGVNPENPFEFELRHDAAGDVYGNLGDALIAFNLNVLANANTDNQTVKIKLNWKSFDGPKSTEFDLFIRPAADKSVAFKADYNRYVE